MKIPSFSECYVGLAVNEDGFLCLTVLKENAARTSFRLTKPKSGGGSRFAGPGREILDRLQKGRFAITGQEDGWWITDCKYDDSGEERSEAAETAPAVRKSKAVRTPPDGWPGGRLRPC